MTTIRKMAKACSKLYRNALQMSRDTLPKYMFEHDVIEFQNEKILGNLRFSDRLYDEISGSVEKMNKQVFQLCESCCDRLYGHKT